MTIEIGIKVRLTETERNKRNSLDESLWAPRAFGPLTVIDIVSASFRDTWYVCLGADGGNVVARKNEIEIDD